MPTSTPTDQLLVEQADGVLTLTFNRPEQRNAMTWEMYDGLERACREADLDNEVRVVVLRAAGEKAFSPVPTSRSSASSRAARTASPMRPASARSWAP